MYHSCVYFKISTMCHSQFITYKGKLKSPKILNQFISGSFGLINGRSEPITGNSGGFFGKFGILVFNDFQGIKNQYFLFFYKVTHRKCPDNGDCMKCCSE